MGPSFSRRYGFRGPRGITIREDAPEGLRIGYLQIAHDEFQLSYTQIRILVCRVLRKFPDFSNWSEIPNVRDEVADCLQTCDWYLIYDIIEATYRQLAPQGTAEAFAKRINELLEEEGIGWQLINGEILTRGPAEFEHSVAQAVETLEEAGYEAAQRELGRRSA